MNRNRFRRRLVRSLGVVLTVMLVLGLLPANLFAFAKTSPPSLSTLEPGGFLNIQQDLTVNVVFISFEAGVGHQNVNEADFLSELPEMYRTVSRYPSFYFGNQFLGLDFNF